MIRLQTCGEVEGTLALLLLLLTFLKVMQQRALGTASVHPRQGGRREGTSGVRRPEEVWANPTLQAVIQGNDRSKQQSWTRWLEWAVVQKSRGGWCAVSPFPQIRYSLRWNRLYLFTQHIEKKQIRETVRCVDVSPTYNDYQQYNTQREKQVLGKWFNIGDRSKKLHHTITYVTKISLTVSTTRLCSQ